MLLAALAGTPLWVWSKLRQGETGEANEEQRLMLNTVSDLVIPRTDTPGASDVGVAEFVIMALNHGLDGTREPASSAAIQGANRQKRERGGLYMLDDLANRLAIKVHGDFNTASPDRQKVALREIDAAAFAEAGGDDPWHKIKNLILTGYYTSEAGGSKELNYELVPGRWNPDLPLRAGDRAFSSDWTAVDFG